MSIQGNIPVAYVPAQPSSTSIASKDIKDNKVGKVAQIAIAGKEDEKTIDAEGRNVLHRASEKGNIDLLKLILKENGHLVNSVDKNGNTPLLLAAHHGHAKACDILRSAGAKLEVTNNEGRNVLHIAAAQDKTAVIELFANDEKLCEGKDEDKLTPLLLAASNGKLESCKTLLKYKARIDQVDEPRTVKSFNTNTGNFYNKTPESQKTVLHYAVKSGNPDVVQLFAVHKELLNSADSDGVTPLLLAASEGHRLICEILLKHGANIESTTKRGNNNVLHLSVARHKNDVAQFFCSDKRFLESQDNNGYTPLLLAVKGDNNEMYQILLGLGAKAEVTTRTGYNALHVAVENQSFKLLDVLLTNRRFLEMKDRYGNTPLLLVMKLLVENRQDRQRYTFESFISILKRLVNAGADKNVTNNEGQTALAIAKDYSNLKEAIIILTEKGSCVRSFLNFLGCNCSKKEKKV